MVKDHSDSEKGNLLLPHRLLLLINSKGSFICTIPQTGYHSLCYTSRGALAGTRLFSQESMQIPMKEICENPTILNLFPKKCINSVGIYNLVVSVTKYNGLVHTKDPLDISWTNLTHTT